MPDYEIRLTVHANDTVDAHQLLTDVILPPHVELLSTSLLGDDGYQDEEVTKTTFLFSVLHRSEDEVDDFSDATDLISQEVAIGQGTLISSKGIDKMDLEDELIEMGDEGDFFLNIQD